MGARHPSVVVILLTAALLGCETAETSNPALQSSARSVTVYQHPLPPPDPIHIGTSVQPTDLRPDPDYYRGDPPKDVAADSANAYHRVQEVLAFLNQIHYDALLNAGPQTLNLARPVALEGDGPSHQWLTLQVDRTDQRSPEVIQVWLYRSETDVSYAKLVVTGDPIGGESIGAFSMNLYEYRLGASPAEDLPLLQGFVSTERAPGGETSLRFMLQRPEPTGMGA